MNASAVLVVILFLFSCSSKESLVDSNDGRVAQVKDDQLQMQSNASTLNTELLDSSWVIESFQTRDGLFHSIPSDAQWGMDFDFDETLSDYVLTINFGPCDPFYISYRELSDGVEKIGEARLDAYVCSASAPVLVSSSLTRQVYTMFNETSIFNVLFDNDSQTTISTDMNEILTIRKL